MLSCIVGAILCAASGNITIPGRLAYAPPNVFSDWTYIAYLQAPVLDQNYRTLRN